MNLSFEWLRSLVPVQLSPAELRDLITSRCATVDEVIALRADLAGVVVGRVVEAQRHPNSDHLWVTKVDAGGGELLDVVCGAPNVREGKLYPFAPTGTVLPGGLKLEKRKIRGATSNGMLCSSRELGLGSEHDGILELQVDAPPGTPFLDAVPVGDTRLVIDVTPNRPDLLSHLGIAREVAAATGVALLAPEARRTGARAETVEREGTTAGVTVRVEDSEGAPRYMGAVIRDVKVEPSPPWLVARLEAVGSRSINNVVDITNYLMHELGQPMHAFDLERLAGSSVIVRRARHGETLTTLDGIERRLTTAMTVIADGDRAQAIAGVMGGSTSEVMAPSGSRASGDGVAATEASAPATRHIFLEVALFDPRKTRATRLALGLTTDASHRFERGVDPEIQSLALARAIEMITDLAGGRLDGTPIDVRARAAPRESVTLRTERVARLLGVPVPADDSAKLLRSIGFDVAVAGPDLRVTAPSWRRDIAREVDLIEEVARLRGFETFPDELRPYRPGTMAEAPLAHTIRRVRTAMIAAGLLEARPMPFVRGEESGFVRVSNPLAEDEAYLRPTILHSLAKRAEHNLARMEGNVRLFEIGAVFSPGSGALPAESVNAAALIMGLRRPPHFTEPKPPPMDAWDAKGLAESLVAAAFPGAAARMDPGTAGDLWSIRVGDEIVGAVRQVELDAPVWASPAFGVELRLSAAPMDPAAPAADSAATRPVPPRYRAIPTTPAAELDLALLVPLRTTAEEVEQVIRRSAGELLERLELFDEFRGAGIPDGFRSVGWRLTFRHPDRTLRDKEVEGRRDKLLRILENELRVRHRTSA
jgi:phenylalanyl-tRNA synthetase beta chain